MPLCIFLHVQHLTLAALLAPGRRGGIREATQKLNGKDLEVLKATHNEPSGNGDKH